MAFMVPVAEYFAAYHIETNCGTEIVPIDVCGTVNVSRLSNDDRERLYPYLEGDRIEGVERKEGWYARLSAPGYLDATSWDGPYDTADEALAAVKDFYDVDDNGDPADQYGTCPHCGSSDLQETPAGTHCASCGVNVDEYDTKGE